MKDTLPTLLKFIGALAVTTAIFFALSPNDNFDDAVINRSMEFLGSKLLAMVPEEQKNHVQREFDDFSEKALDGKVSDERFKDVAVMILNAEAEGKKFDRLQVDSLITAIREAIPALDRQLKGFALPDAIMTAVETRTSSPIRINRGADYQSINTRGLYPAGEGASYAGGIYSAAIDGIEVAQAVALAMAAPA